MPARFLVVVIAVIASSAVAQECTPSEAEIEAAHAEWVKAGNRLGKPGVNNDEAAMAWDAAYRKKAALRQARDTCLSDQRRAQMLLESEKKKAEQLRAEKDARDEREAEFQAREAEKAEILEAATQPAVYQVLASVHLCDEQAEEKRLLKKIQQEKANSKIAGVVNPSRLLALQDEVVYSRELQGGYRERLAGVKLKALGCSHKAVQALIGCRETGACDENLRMVLVGLQAVELRK